MSVPKLRFKEFNDQWAERILGDIFTFKNGVNASKEQYGSGFKFINVLDIINNNFIAYENIIGSVNITDEEFTKNEVKHGDVLFQRSSETREEVGQSNVYIGSQSVTFGGFVIRGKGIAEYNPYFFNYILKTDSVRDEITQRSGGSTRYNIGQDALNVIPIFIPTVTEQTKIANFLTAIDEKITQLTQKHDLLAQYKKGVMQQIFSQKLRFKDDDGREFPGWEKILLGNICSINTGKLDANAMVENGDYRFYTCAKDYYFIDKYAFDTNALLISGNGANVGYIHHYNGRFNAYQRTYVLDRFDQNIIFIKYFLEENLHARIFKEKKEGNTPYIVLGTLTEMELMLPSVKEQTKIANFLTAIDDKITHTQAQLKAVKQYKQGLLQQLFV